MIRLIGMMDSPYVRRVAISLEMLGLPFQHEPVSVFRHYDAFAAINPVVKAPTLITDGGIVLMDSTVILEHLERLVPSDRSLTPAEPDAHARCQRIIGLALAACEKTVQIVYERDLRPPEKQHQPWLDRIQSQLRAAYTLLEAELTDDTAWIFGGQPCQADITAAVAWRFTQDMAVPLDATHDYPRLARLATRAETLPAFVAYPPT